MGIKAAFEVFRRKPSEPEGVGYDVYRRLRAHGNSDRLADRDHPGHSCSTDIEDADVSAVDRQIAHLDGVERGAGCARCSVNRCSRACDLDRFVGRRDCEGQINANCGADV